MVLFSMHYLSPPQQERTVGRVLFYNMVMHTFLGQILWYGEDQRSEHQHESVHLISP